MLRVAFRWCSSVIIIIISFQPTSDYDGDPIVSIHGRVRLSVLFIARALLIDNFINNKSELFVTYSHDSDPITWVRHAYHARWALSLRTSETEP